MIFVLSKTIWIQNGSAFCNGHLSIVTVVYSRLSFFKDATSSEEENGKI